MTPVEQPQPVSDRTGRTSLVDRINHVSRSNLVLQARFRPRQRSGHYGFQQYSPLGRRRTFGLIATVLAAVVGVTLAAASHNNKWWSDNLMGPDSSNFVPVDQIKKTNVGQLEVAWFYPYATKRHP